MDLEQIKDILLENVRGQRYMPFNTRPDKPKDPRIHQSIHVYTLNELKTLVVELEEYQKKLDEYSVLTKEFEDSKKKLYLKFREEVETLFDMKTHKNRDKIWKNCDNGNQRETVIKYYDMMQFIK